MASSSGDRASEIAPAVTPEVVQRVLGLFIRNRYGHRAIARQLERDGTRISESAIKNVLLDHGLKHRYRDATERAAALEKARIFLIKEDRDSLTACGFGVPYQYEYLNIQAGDLVGRRPPFFDEQQSERRRIINWRHHENFRVPGPNFVWSLDGFEQLEKLGLSIYACVDVYSRMILWVYVGRLEMAGSSTLKQYLRTIAASGVRPLITRSDHGVAIPFWTSAQAILADLDGVEVDFVDRANLDARRIYRQGTRTASCHLKGTGLSSDNERFPLWWENLISPVANRWIEIANEMIKAGSFVSALSAHQIAATALFGPMIQQEITEMAELWNGHRIQPQSTPLQVGVPEDLYQTDQARNWAVPLGAAALRELDEMLDDVDSVDINDLLPPSTFSWCESQLRELGFNRSSQLQSPSDHKQLCLQTYTQLRDRVQAHMDNGNDNPCLQTPQLPNIGLGRFLEMLHRNAPWERGEGITGDEVPSELIGHINNVMEEMAKLKR